VTAGHLLLIDSSGFAYRAYHALSPRFRSDGMPTHAIIGFMSLLSKMIDRADKDPYQFAAAVFDAPGPTFRHKLYPQYKAHRIRPEDLNRQMPILREAAHVMGFEPVELVGYEADDMIATLATIGKASQMRTTIVSIDKDFCQLVEDNVVEIANPVERTRVLEADVLKKFGVEPHLVPDVQALCGDAVDNIPGVPGIGLKTASGLIRRFGSLEGLRKALNKPSEWTGRTRIRDSLRKEAPNFGLYRKLVTLKCMAPWPGEIMSLRPQAPSEPAIRDMLRLLDAEALYESMFERGARPPRVVPAMADPFEWWKEELRARGQVIPPTPQCGFYERRLNRHTPPVVARIWREPERDFLTEQPTGMQILRCEVNGDRKDPYDMWGYLCAKPITIKAYESRSGKRVEIITAPVDFTKLPPPTFGRKRARS